MNNETSDSFTHTKKVLAIREDSQGPPGSWTFCNGESYKSDGCSPWPPQSCLLLGCYTRFEAGLLVRRRVKSFARLLSSPQPRGTLAKASPWRFLSAGQPSVFRRQPRWSLDRHVQRGSAVLYTRDASTYSQRYFDCAPAFGRALPKLSILFGRPGLRVMSPHVQ
jgi:hypothetical protein